MEQTDDRSLGVREIDHVPGGPVPSGTPGEDDLPSLFPGRMAHLADVADAEGDAGSPLEVLASDRAPVDVPPFAGPTLFEGVVRWFISRTAIPSYGANGRGPSGIAARGADARQDVVSERGTYIVIEGIDGTGKTGLATRLVPALLGRGHSISSYHEPTDRFLRAQFPRIAKLDSLAAALSATLDRALLRPEIEAALDQGDVVLQDRSFYSTLAYHGPALSDESLRELERIERAISREPDVVLYLDAPVEVALQRFEGKGQLDQFEDEPYLTKVKRRFEQMFQPPQWVRINATGSPDQTFSQAMNALLAAGL